MTRTLAALLVILSAGAAFATPINGTYQSTDRGGTVLLGLWSESYQGGGPLQVGDVMHAASLNGSALATMWEIQNPAVNSAPSVVFNDVVAGTGTIEYLVNYSGGTLTLKNTGPWYQAGDSGDYVVDILNYRHLTTIEFEDNAIVYQFSEVRFDGTFEGYPRSLAYEVLTAHVQGDGSTLPAGYPAWIPGTASQGEWGDVSKIKINITPEPTTLLLLSVFGLALKRRAKTTR